MKQISISILLTFLFFTNIYAIEEGVDLKDAIIETPNQIKNKKEYQNKENFLAKPPKDKEILQKKDANSISFDANIDINKEKKDIDGVKVNLGTKF